MTSSEIMKRPRTCKEENCTPLMVNGDYNPKKPFSAQCIGVRTGVIKGKEKAIENEPTDVIVTCHLIGAHSESKGKYSFVSNVGDQYLTMWAEFVSLWKLGLLKRTFRSVLNITGIHIVQELQWELERYNEKQLDSHLYGVGTKFIEFSCSCKEIFFREHNYDQRDGGYYKPNRRDEIFFDVHRKLGHTIYYKKAKMVKKSKVGDNSRWQDWGLHEYR